MLEDLLENIEMDAFLALYSQVSMKLNKASKFKLQLYLEISFSCFFWEPLQMYLDTVLLIVTTSSGVCSLYYHSLQLILTYFQPFEFYRIILLFVHLQILPGGCPIASYSVRQLNCLNF